MYNIFWENDTTGNTLVIWRHKRVPCVLQRRMSAPDWPMLKNTLLCRKTAWVYPAVATFLEKSTLIFGRYPTESGNETLLPPISPAFLPQEITFRNFPLPQKGTKIHIFQI